MLDLASFFISAAHAQEAASAVPEGTQAALMQYVPFVLIFGVFYFLVIRPQQKKISEQDTMVKALKVGDRVITSGGIHGKVAKIEEGLQLMLEIAEGVQIKIDRDNLVALETKPQAVSEGGKK